MKVVLDTNILISAFIEKRGKPAKVLSTVERFELVSSTDTLAELERVLHYDRIKKKYKINESLISEYLQKLKDRSVIIEPSKLPKKISKDPDDDKFLNLAEEAGPEYLVSGDPHLLDLGEYQGIKIVTPAEF